MKIETKYRIRRVLEALRAVAAWVILGLSLLITVLTLVSVNVVDQQGRDLFGYRFFIVQSDSMAATDFAAGDLVLVQEVDPATLEAGDIITFVSQNWGSLGEIMTHKIRQATTDSMGNPGYITYGTTTDSDDETVVTYEHIIGQYRSRIPGAGKIFAYIQTVPGMISLLLLPFVLVLFLHGWGLFSRFCRWRDEEIRGLEEKQEEIRRMMDALKGLRGAYEGRAEADFLADAENIIAESERRMAPSDTVNAAADEPAAEEADPQEGDREA